MVYALYLHISDICGTSYSSEKRHAKVSKAEKEERPQKNMTITNEKDITFDETDRTDLQEPHHDGLVITLYIANHFFRTILVDGGSSISIILLDALKRMNILKFKVVRRSLVLIGFSGIIKHTVKKIKLHI